MTEQTAQPLAGQRVWLTRPAHQAAEWAAGLEAAGAVVDVEPLLDIAPPDDEATARAALAAAERADVIIATSPNAVRAAWRLRPDFAPTGRLCAVGDATGAALRQATGRAVDVPHAADTSEALLDLPILSNVAGATVALLSGAGGRRQLTAELAARGAQVHKVALYRRRPVAIEHARLAALINANHAAVVTSGEALLQLCALLQSCSRAAIAPGLRRIQLVVPSPRVVQLTPVDLFERPPRAVARMTVDAVVAALARGDQASDNSQL